MRRYYSGHVADGFEEQEGAVHHGHLSSEQDKPRNLEQHQQFLVLGWIKKQQQQQQQQTRAAKLNHTDLHY